MNNILELKNVNKIYGTAVKTQVLTDINLSFEKGSFNSIIGQSGSGKSTPIARSVTPDAHISLDPIVCRRCWPEGSPTRTPLVRQLSISVKLKTLLFGMLFFSVFQAISAYFF